jgi:hypothetical protein
LLLPLALAGTDALIWLLALWGGKFVWTNIWGLNQEKL